MKKLESSLLNMVLVLTSVAVIMGGVLAFVNHLTEGPIADQKARRWLMESRRLWCATT